MYAGYTSDELYHHGIKGMKWGVRRYQNKDGSYTPKGRQRERANNSEKKRKIAKGIATGAAISATAILAAYAIKNPRTRAIITKVASRGVNSVKSFATDQKTKDFVNKMGSKAVKSLSESASRVGKAMTDAAMISMGGIAISKLSKRLETDENASESVKNRNKVILDTATAGITSLTKANSSSNKGNNKGGSVGKEVSDALGTPSKKPVDKSSSEYQGLFKDSNGNQRDQDVRSTIKSLANAGYDVDQINEYLRKIDDGTLKHSYEDIKYELNYLSAVNYIDYLFS